MIRSIGIDVLFPFPFSAMSEDILLRLQQGEFEDLPSSQVTAVLSSEVGIEAI